MSAPDEAGPSEQEYAEALRLPQANIDRIMHRTLPKGINAGKDVRTMFNRAAAVFLLCLSSSARDQAQKHKRKGITVKDIQAAVKDMRLDLNELNQAIEVFTKHLEKEKARQDLEAAAEEEAMNTTEPDENVRPEGVESPAEGTEVEE